MELIISHKQFVPELKLALVYILLMPMEHKTLLSLGIIQFRMQCSLHFRVEEKMQRFVGHQLKRK